jgi:hypothetical protein
MYSRWYEVAVVVLWLAAMGWLVTQKVLPTLLVGDPPSTEAMLEARKPDVPLCWSVSWNDRRLGWAMSTTSRQPDDSTKIRSLVHFDELPLGDMIPDMFKAFLPDLKKVGNQFQMETRNVLLFSPEGKLKGFDSAVKFDPLQNAVEVHGVVEGSMLSLGIRASGFYHETEMRMPPQAMLSDALSPEVSLPGLHRDQTWTVKTYSPLRPPNSPIEVMRARVERMEPLLWNDRLVDVWLVTYSPDSGSVLRRTDRPRAKLWVRPDGTVLKQESSLFDSVMTFVRMPEDEAAELAGTVEEW